MNDEKIKESISYSLDVIKSIYLIPISFVVIYLILPIKIVATIAFFCCILPTAMFLSKYVDDDESFIVSIQAAKTVYFYTFAASITITLLIYTYLFSIIMGAILSIILIFGWTTYLRYIGIL